MRDAMLVCKRLGYTAKSAHRDRRPTLDELDRLLRMFESKYLHRPKSIPMHKIVAFALFSTRRQDEITRIRRDDDARGLDVDGGRVFVPDMKHPGDKRGNDVWCDLPAPAMRIALSMPAR